MPRRSAVRLATIALGLVAILASGPGSRGAAAESVEEFYRGKQIKLLLSAAPGGGADFYARILVNHLGKHIPGHPSFVIISQPGAGGLVAAAALQSTAPKDGSMIGFLQRNNLLEPVLAERDINFDPRRVAWVGSLNRDTYVIVAWHTSGIRTIADVMARELVLGNTGGGNENITFPLLLNQIAGTKFKLTRGYKGSDEVALAIERGEVQGRAMGWSSFKAEHSPWIKEKKINVLVQIAMQKHADLKDIPLALDFVKSDEDRRLYELILAPLDAGRPFAVPLETPPDRIAAIRAAFEAVTKDTAFVSEVEGRGGSVELTRGEEMQALVTKLYQAPKELIARARALVQAK
jgi:tripartite-type tricarboxylate transporter receptor subunit TctC